MGATTVQPDENLRFLYVCLKNTNGKDQVSYLYTKRYREVLTMILSLYRSIGPQWLLL